MSDTHEAGGGRRFPLGWAIGAMAALGAVFALYVIVSAAIKPDDGRPRPVTQQQLRAYAVGELAKLDVPAQARPAPAVAFAAADGAQRTLADFKGRVVVVNLWATWCAPCVKEMPTLAGLDRSYDDRVAVLPISTDRPGDQADARSFIGRHAPLAYYADPSFALAFGLTPPAQGFPTTVIFDREGRERARLSGDADWNGAQAHALIDRLLADPT